MMCSLINAYDDLMYQACRSIKNVVNDLMDTGKQHELSTRNNFVHNEVLIDECI